MRWVLVLAAALTIAGTVVSRNPEAQNVTTLIEISRMDPGLAPDDFTFCRTGDGDVGDWRVLEDPSASDRQVIAQMSKDPTDYRFQLAVYRPISAKNVDVVLRLKPVGGTRLVESSCGSPRQTTITRSAPVLSKTMSGSIAWSRASGNSLTARTSKSPPTNGTRSGCGPKMTGSLSPSMEANCSQQWTAPSSVLEKWGCGPRPTA